MAEKTSTRINIALPVSLLEEMNRYIPRRERSRFSFRDRSMPRTWDELAAESDDSAQIPA